jgi:ABC-2 type transport system ATP-binding protein
MSGASAAFRLSKSKPNKLSILVLLATFLGLSACSLPPSRVSQFTGNTEYHDLPETFYHVNIQSFDGTKLKATVFQPHLKAGEKAPLIIHAHGFAVGRMNNPISISSSLVISGKSALALWKKGYWVISYDHRGFGGSEGKIHLMDPEKEVKDLSSVIDWSTTNLPALAFDDTAKTDPTVGTVGESYGGAVQIMASMKDARINAIVPVTTWYDLSEALAPNGHVKTLWASVLISSGTITSMFDMDIAFTKAFRDSVNGKLSTAAQELLHSHSPAYFCEQGIAPKADALVIQGFRDSMFPLNHGLANKHCIDQGQAKSKIIAIQGGHILPIQKWTGLPLYNTDQTIHCEQQSFTLMDSIQDFLESKLKHKPEMAAYIPDTCVTKDYKTGVVLDHIPKGGERLYVKSTDLVLGSSGFMGLSTITNFLLKPIDWVKSLQHKNELPNLADLSDSGGIIRPAFLPLKVIDKAGVMTGTPIAQIEINSSKDNAVVFVGIGIKGKNDTSFTLVSEQVTPISGQGKHQVELSAISQKLDHGDVLGLVVYGAHPQYMANSNWVPAQASVSGLLELPLIRRADTGMGYVAYSSPSTSPNNSFDGKDASKIATATTSTALPQQANNANLIEDDLR